MIPLTTAALHEGALVFADGTPCRVEPPACAYAALSTVDGRPGAGFLVDASFDPGFTAHLNRHRGETGAGFGARRASSGTLAPT